MNDQTYNELFTMHGTIMIFLFVMPMFSGFANFLVPLMIGAPDVAFPRINALSFWMVPVAGLIMISGFLVKGGAAAAGWTGYAPLSQQSAQLGEKGQDLWIVALIIIAAASLLGFDQLHHHDPEDARAGHDDVPHADLRLEHAGHVAARPARDPGAVRRADHAVHRPEPGRHRSSTRSRGGSAILWQNVFWFFGHPEVYILILPAFGIISEIIPVFSRKPLFGYRAFVFATLSIGALSFSGVGAPHVRHRRRAPAVLLDHDVPDLGADRREDVQLDRHDVGGKIKLDTPMLFAVGFLLVFLIGGINGASRRSSRSTSPSPTPTSWWRTCTTCWSAGRCSRSSPAFYFWMPKMTGRLLSERLGKLNFWLLFIGVNLTFFPMHTLGLDGMQRRIADYPANAGYRV